MEIYRYSNIHEPIPLTIFYFTSKFINSIKRRFCQRGRHIAEAQMMHHAAKIKDVNIGVTPVLTKTSLV